MSKLIKWSWINKAAESANESQSKTAESANESQSKTAESANESQSKTAESANESQSEKQLADLWWNMASNLATTYDDWDSAINALMSYIEKYSTRNYFQHDAFAEFKNSSALQDFGGYSYKKTVEEIGTIDYKQSNVNLEYHWNGIIISYSDQWQLFEIDGDIKILPIYLNGNGQIDISIRDNSENISNLSEFLYKKNLTRMRSFSRSKKITSKEIVVLNSLSSLIYFSYSKQGVAMVSYQVVLSSFDNKQLCFIKYEEERDVQSSVSIFENFIESLREEKTEVKKTQVSQETKP
jgi:hypothetical protein